MLSLFKGKGTKLKPLTKQNWRQTFFFLHCLIRHISGSFNRKFNRKSKVFYYHSPFTGVRSSNLNSMEHWHCVRYSEMKDFIWSVFYMTKNNPHFFVFQPILWHWLFSKAPENICECNSHEFLLKVCHSQPTFIVKTCKNKQNSLVLGYFWTFWISHK